MDKGYDQDKLDQSEWNITGTSMNPMFDQMNFEERLATSLHPDWDLDAIGRT